MIDLSVVIPIFNEVDTIGTLYARLEKVMAELGVRYEIIFVNDGSTDGSLEAIRVLSRENYSVKCLDLSRNFGLQIAYSAGINHAEGNSVVVMDGDLQDPPELIPRLVEKLKEDYDVVYTVKTKRQESLLKRFAFAAFYRILQNTSSVEMPLDAGSFSIMSRKAVDAFKKMPEKSRLLSGMRAWVGFRQTGIEFERDARFHGEPRQTLGRLIRMATDGLFSFSTVPIRAATVLGLIASAISLISMFVVFMLRFFTNLIEPSGWTSLMITVMFLGGVQLIFIGILGEYIGRIYDEVKERPLYLVREKIGFDDK